MRKKPYVPFRIRPANATPELAMKLHEDMTLQQIADAWGISKTAVWLLIQKAQRNAKRAEVERLAAQRQAK